MSYGFFAWQLPLLTRPATAMTDEGGDTIDRNDRIRLLVCDVHFECHVPDIWVLTTRSGCNKTSILPERDIVCMGLKDGEIIFRTPAGSDPEVDYKPSFDMVTILAHALGNALAAQLLAAFVPGNPFSGFLAKRGMGITHWHGYPQAKDLPNGYCLHGSDNPSVPCSTPQSAIFALLGKLSAVSESIASESVFRGDVQHEPHHGTNVNGMMSLTETAQQFAKELR
jgi:hypothetical protein